MFMVQNKQLASGILILLFLTIGCKSNNQNIFESKEIKGHIKGMHISYFLTREGCRFTTIYFLLDIENFSSETVYLPFTYFQSHCDREIEVSNSYWVVLDEKIPLAVLFEDSLVRVQPNQTSQVKLKAMMLVNEKKITEFKNNNTSWAELPFSINYQVNDKMIAFKKSNDFKFSLSVNDMAGLEGIRSLFSSDFPPLPPPTFLDTIELSTEEIEPKSW